MPDTQTHVIVGAGLAGAKAAEALRAEGFEGSIVLVGDEPELPYERPPLSKDYLRGESPREKARAHPEDFYSANGIDLHASTMVSEIDTVANEVVLSTGDRVGYDRLLLSVGAAPRRLAVPGSALDGVHYLRDPSDADRIAARLDAGGRVIVIGGGWIGAEVAASAPQKGLDVTIVEQSNVPLERVLGREVGEIYGHLHRDHGVEVLTAAVLQRFEGSGRVERVRLAEGRPLETDFVVLGWA
jgi:3-phenylpropionate/trans-cinnamate dioxygenase ferredoxin reductase subunit